MSIVDAIERAKKMGQERARAEASAQARTRGREGRSAVPPPAARTAAAAQPASAPDRAREDAGEFIASLPRNDYVPAICERYHIIVPEVDAGLAKAALPPYRMLRTRLLQRCRSSGWSALAVTSPGPGDGKSVTAVNLALSLAREGNQEVFLIDGDMRKPSICQYLGVRPAVEISSFFTGHCAPLDPFFNIGIDHLAVAGSLGPVENASELLATGRLQELLAAIQEVSPNRIVILDVPPVVNTDDALVIAPSMDAVLLVASEGMTRRDGLESALGLLSDFTLAGVVLNRTFESIGADYYGVT